jgi:hypothetical protein
MSGLMEVEIQIQIQIQGNTEKTESIQENTEKIPRGLRYGACRSNGIFLRFLCNFRAFCVPLLLSLPKYQSS